MNSVVESIYKEIDKLFEEVESGKLEVSEEELEMINKVLKKHQEAFKGDIVMSNVKSVVVSFMEFNHPDFKNPTKYFIRNALGDYVFYKTSKRQLAQEAVDMEYGKGKYKVTNYSFNTDKVAENITR